MNIKYLGFIAVAIFMDGCSTTKQESFSAPDGSVVKEIKCSQSPTDCYKEASKSCPNGQYRVLSSESHAGGLVADIFPGPVTWYGMTIKCGPSDGRMPTFPFDGPEYTPPAQVNVHHSGSVRHY